MHFVAKLRDLSGGKPVGFKMYFFQFMGFVSFVFGFFVFLCGFCVACVACVACALVLVFLCSCVLVCSCLFAQLKYVWCTPPGVKAEFCICPTWGNNKTIEQ